MTTLYWIVTGLIIALGMLHVGFTRLNYARFDMNAMWFLGSGLAIILAGFLNIAVIRRTHADKLVWVLGLITNLSFAVLFGIGLMLLTQPQVFVGLALFSIATLCTLLDRGKATFEDSP
jgi:lysylphosphatidylglycerol synthetase-like protein (DUF2156 family)